MNADKLKLIQVGISLATDDGFLPEGVTTWQFNFKFDLTYAKNFKISFIRKDEHAEDAIELLSKSGIQFAQHAEKGINP
jgi:CCR4-NOT transcription complex subunit 7/8